MSIALLAIATGCSNSASKQPTATNNPSKEPVTQAQQKKPVSTQPVVVIKDPPAIIKEKPTASMVSSKIEGGEIVVTVKSETDQDISLANAVFMGLDKNGKDVKVVSVEIKDLKPAETKEVRVKNENSDIVSLKEMNLVAATIPKSTPAK
jgi:hypothetical protein